MNEKLLKPYNPQETESRIYKIWEASGFFNPDVCVEKGATKKDATAFSIMMPPPNVTGILHMGHGLMITVEDIMVRFNRMRGKKTLWVPGTDHAAIATQAKVEKDILKKEDKSRHDLGRDELIKRIEKYATASHDTIETQIKKLGASCDWSREAFTLDEIRSRAVFIVFKKMFDDGIIYRGQRIINWDPKGQTTISDDEIVYETRKTKLYTFKYSKDFPIAIATTRPETKVGDVAVAVHPDDKRYRKFVGKEFDAVFAGEPIHIKIIADSAVDKEFGTGAVGITPAHSFTDAEIAARHELSGNQIINELGRMNVSGKILNNKKILEAREIVVDWLKKENLLENEVDIEHNVATAERTGGMIEPLPKLQWFVNVNKPIAERCGKTLKELMREPIANGKIKIIPDYFEKTYFNWIDNLRDWCISRQIWYGHRVPVWYKGEEIRCSVQKPDSGDWTQDSDTLDTWFSSSLWTFSALGWPDKKEMEKNHFEIFHPTNVLETGYEIIFFWVARMILMTEYVLGTIPFQNVYFHGTVRDAKGRKMSKSLDNGMDPTDVAEKFGADAGRLAIISGTAAGTDSKIDENKIKGYKHFANKLWNITRFVLENTEDFDRDLPLSEKEIEIKNTLYKEKLDFFNSLNKDVTSDLENYRFHLASEKLYAYVWHEFADKIIEDSKKLLQDKETKIKEPKIRRVTQYVLFEILETCLKMLHPFAPFVTEEIWSLLPNRKNLLIIEPWPSL